MTDGGQLEPHIEIAGQTKIRGDTHTVVVRHLKTPKGERLELRSTDDVLRVDALGLESLSWQDQDVLADFRESEPERGAPTPVDDSDGGCEFTLSNEYADVRVRSVQSPAGDVLVVEAPKKQFQVRLDAAALAGLAKEDTSIFSEFLETPHGPGGHAH